MRNIVNNKTAYDISELFVEYFENNTHGDAYFCNALIAFINIVGYDCFGYSIKTIISHHNSPEIAVSAYKAYCKPKFKTPDGILIWNLLNLDFHDDFLKAVENVCFCNRNKKITALLNN